MDTRAELLTEIEAFLAERKISHTTFGLMAVNDGKFVARLRERRNMTFNTIDRARSYIAAARASSSHRRDPQTTQPTQSAATPS